MLLAYHNDPAIKAAALATIEAHRKADHLVQDYGYWKDGKGCAVGCQIESGNHAEYETRFGIPQMLAMLEDTIFEGLPCDDARLWPERFIAAPRVGADLSRVGWQFLHWLLTDEKVNPGISHPLVRDVVKQCADVIAPLSKGESEATAESAASAAWSAASAASAESARSAASAAWSAASAESARSAASAAWSAAKAAWSAANAESARSAAWSAASAERSAARSAACSAARAASAASTAESAARSAAWIQMADKLIELMEAA